MDFLRESINFLTLFRIRQFIITSDAPSAMSPRMQRDVGNGHDPRAIRLHEHCVLALASVLRPRRRAVPIPLDAPLGVHHRPDVAIAVP